MKTRRRVPFLSGLCIVACAAIVASYWFRGGGPGSAKDVWDWAQLLIIPLALLLLAAWFNAVNRKKDRIIAAEHLSETILQAYLASMAELLLEKDLRTSQPGAEVRSLARARTVTLLSQVPAKQKLRAVQFLCESQLIGIVDMNGADLSATNLSGATLSGANLSNANLCEVNLSKADLSKADLHGADLSASNLSGAYLSMADLSYATLSRANLRETNLSGANLSKADLSYAFLSGANLIVTDLSRADLNEADLSGARLSGANLNGTNMSGTDLSGANLKDTYMSLEQVTQAKGIPDR